MESLTPFSKRWQQRLTWSHLKSVDVAFGRMGPPLAFQAQIPAELIKRLGDWKSDAYRSYIHNPVKDRMLTVRQLASFV